MDPSFGSGATLPTTEIGLRIGLAFLLGACAGVERQWHHKNAGLRTHTLVAVGAAAFTMVSSFGYGLSSNPMVIAASVVTGIGFIGGGVIMHRGQTVQGINTAATLWTTASIGLAVGAGYYALTVMVFLALMIVQFPLQRVEEWIDRRSE